MYSPLCTGSRRCFNSFPTRRRYTLLQSGVPLWLPDFCICKRTRGNGRRYFGRLLRVCCNVRFHPSTGCRNYTTKQLSICLHLHRNHAQLPLIFQLWCEFSKGRFTYRNNEGVLNGTRHTRDRASPHTCFIWQICTIQSKKATGTIIITFCDNDLDRTCSPPSFFISLRAHYWIHELEPSPIPFLHNLSVYAWIFWMATL